MKKGCAMEINRNKIKNKYNFMIDKGDLHCSKLSKYVNIGDCLSCENYLLESKPIILDEER
jgi:hypothetical protein